MMPNPPALAKKIAALVVESLHGQHAIQSDVDETAAIIQQRVGPLVEALKFYGDKENWDDHGRENGLYWVEHIPAIDGGEKARAALTHLGGEDAK